MLTVVEMNTIVQGTVLVILKKDKKGCWGGGSGINRLIEDTHKMFKVRFDKPMKDFEK
jgi:hypothetical protein